MDNGKLNLRSVDESEWPVVCESGAKVSVFEVEFEVGSHGEDAALWPVVGVSSDVAALSGEFVSLVVGPVFA